MGAISFSCPACGYPVILREEPSYPTMVCPTCGRRIPIPEWAL